MARTVVVSRGGTGIGRAVARRFAVDGDRVTIIGRRADVLASAAAEINAEAGAGRVSVVAADLAEPDEVERAAAAVLAVADTIDVVVNNAGGVGGAAEEGLRESRRTGRESSAATS
jgi:3-oxoacyl-[acyl-carrier protein] reductase